MLVYFGYGETETAYLRRKDPRLGAVIDRVGMIERAVDPDLFRLSFITSSASRSQRRRRRRSGGGCRKLLAL